MTEPLQHPLRKILESRIAIIDGAMGTTIRTYGMKEADIRGRRFADARKEAHSVHLCASAPRLLLQSIPSTAIDLSLRCMRQHLSTQR